LQIQDKVHFFQKAKYINKFNTNTMCPSKEQGYKDYKKLDTQHPTQRSHNKPTTPTLLQNTTTTNHWKQPKTINTYCWMHRTAIWYA